MDQRELSQATQVRALSLMGIVLLLLLPVGALGQSPDDFVGTDTCFDCHDDMATDFARSLHGQLRPYQYPGLADGCEACHGPGARHVESEDPADIFIPQAELGNDGVAGCLACHKTGHTLDWEFSSHAESDVACLSCHKIHGGSHEALLADKEEDLCFSCHMETRGQFQLPSHHPLKEGFMTCSTCHDVHGDRFTDITDGESNREACLGCHAQHAGPFIFEHSPVMEDCGICHNVHGAVANNLLVQNEPFLCLQCHQPHFHSILSGYTGDYSAPAGVVAVDDDYDGLTGHSEYDSMKRVMLTKCTQCHQSIHGSDLPSQSITGQGRALNR